jgi:O-antigen ligase
MRMIWIGFSLTAVLLGAVCLVQHLVLGAPRAYGLNGGDWGAIEFAMFLLVLALLALLQLLHSQAGRLEKIVHASGLVLAMYGALLTQSRGTLIAFVPVFMLVLANYARDTGHWRRSLLLAGAVVCGGVLAGISVHGEVLARFARVGPEVVNYDQRGDELGSVGERLAMWRSAGHAALDHPLTGVGIDQFGAYLRRQVAHDRASPEIAKYDHPHNEYLEWAATGGVPGLLVLLSMFGFPLAYFVRHARRGGQDVRVAAIAGVAVILMYMLCALTDNVFYRAMPHSLYFFLVLGLTMLIASRDLSSPQGTPGV